MGQPTQRKVADTEANVEQSGADIKEPMSNHFVGRKDDVVVA